MPINAIIGNEISLARTYTIRDMRADQRQAEKSRHLFQARKLNITCTCKTVLINCLLGAALATLLSFNGITS